MYLGSSSSALSDADYAARRSSGPGSPLPKKPTVAKTLARSLLAWSLCWSLSVYSALLLPVRFHACFSPSYPSVPPYLG